MGNISNPVITRLGINQFWYKHWHVDRNEMLSKTLKQDRIIEELLRLYLSYGLNYQNNPFYHEYWYKVNLRNPKTQILEDNMKFFRRFFYTNDVVGIEHSYFLRNFSGDYFPFKVWLMRYCGWLVVSIHWFKPVKWRLRRAGVAGVDYTLPAYSAETKRSVSGVHRLKILLYLYTRTLCRVRKSYTF